MNNYQFDVKYVKTKILENMKEFLDSIRCNNVVLGISGGKDSTICAALAKEVVGADHVYGVMMPNGEQTDIQDSLEVIKTLGIKSLTVNIEDAFCSIRDSIENNGIDVNNDTKVNLPPRVRMSVLYAIAQSVNGCVLCTDNLSERITGYFTLYGDGAGSYAPLRDLTVTEVRQLGIHLGLPEHLVMKVPGDGLQPEGDEVRIGMTYAELDTFIRTGIGNEDLKEKIFSRYLKNKFKTEIVDIPGPMFSFPNYVSLV